MEGKGQRHTAVVGRKKTPLGPLQQMVIAGGLVDVGALGRFNMATESVLRELLLLGGPGGQV